MFIWHKDTQEENLQKLEAHYQDNKAFLLAYGSKILGSREKAEDTLQETFLAIIEKQEKYFSLSCTDFRKLAVIIMKNKSIDRLRREKRLSKEELQEDQIPILEQDPVGSDLVRKERREAAREALEKLDPLSQLILQLKYFEDKSYKEISQQLEISPNLVQVKLYRAREKIRKILKEEGEDERR